MLLKSIKLIQLNKILNIRIEDLCIKKCNKMIFEKYTHALIIENCAHN